MNYEDHVGQWLWIKDKANENNEFESYGKVLKLGTGYVIIQNRAEIQDSLQNVPITTEKIDKLIDRHEAYFSKEGTYKFK